LDFAVWTHQGLFTPKQIATKKLKRKAQYNWHCITYLQKFHKNSSVCSCVPHWQCPLIPRIHIKIWLPKCKNCFAYCGSSLRPYWGSARGSRSFSRAV